jgi:hypothetical protein
MVDKATLKRIERLIGPYRVTGGRGFRLADIDPADTHRLGAENKADAAKLKSLAAARKALAAEKK